VIDYRAALQKRLDAAQAEIDKMPEMPTKDSAESS
jgi:hypothetical protein